MNPSIQVDLFDERLNDLQALDQTTFDQYLKNELGPLSHAYKMQGGKFQQLKKELQQLLDTSNTPSANSWVFVDEWSTNLFAAKDLGLATRGRNLLQLLYTAFEASATLKRIAERFARRETELMEAASADQIFSWMKLWTTITYPNLTLFLLGKTRTEPYRSFRHLPLGQIIRYLPGFMLWNIGYHLKISERRVLLQDLAEGKHVRNCSHCPAPFTKKMAHHFSQAPVSSRFKTAVWYGIICGLNGTEKLIPVFQQHFGQWQGNMDLIKTLLAFFQTPKHQVETEEVKRLFGYVDHLRQEGADCSLKGWTLNSLRRRSDRWHAQINFANRHRLQHGWSLEKVKNALKESWTGANYLGYKALGEAVEYHIIQLTTVQELLDEGQAMQHCVGSYVSSCQLAGTSIWSLRKLKDGQVKRLVTIEVSKMHRIVQAKRKSNAAPQAFHWRLIRAWAKRENLSLS